MKTYIKPMAVIAVLALLGFALWLTEANAPECDTTSPHYNEHQCARMTKD